MPNFDPEKLQVALRFQKPGYTITDQLVLHDFTRESGEERDGFASGDTDTDAADIEVTCYWTMDGQRVVTKMVGNLTYGVCAHSGEC